MVIDVLSLNSVSLFLSSRCQHDFSLFWSWKRSFQLRHLLPNQVHDIMYSVIYVPLFLLYVCHLSQRGRTFPFIARWRAWVRNLQYVICTSGTLRLFARSWSTSYQIHCTVLFSMWTSGKLSSGPGLGEHSQPTHCGPPSRRVIIAIIIALPSSLYPLIWVNVYVLHHSTLIRKSPKSGQHSQAVSVHVTQRTSRG